MTPSVLGRRCRWIAGLTVVALAAYFAKLYAVLLIEKS